MTAYVGAIDQGTSSTRFVVVDGHGQIVVSHQQEHAQHFPRPGWVEHDANEIWAVTQTVISKGLAHAGISAGDLAAVGITNQRETTLAWDPATGEPLGPAIVWQDVRTQELCDSLAGSDGPDRFRSISGLPLATYFSGPKMRWLLDNGLQQRAEHGEVLLGTMDSWLAWKLTGRHITDVTNASRTMLMDLSTLDWSQDMLAAMDVPRTALGEITSSSEVYGEAAGVLAGVPVASMLGDQQAAMFGQACFEPGSAKNTYGTGCFLLLHTGGAPIHSDHGLLTTVAYQLGDSAAQYALEGSVAMAGATVQWLRDNLGLIEAAGDIEALAASVEDNGDVYLVPAFSGLFAPHWRPDARGTIVGLTRFATGAHLARAALEATAYQTKDVLAAMESDSGSALSNLKVDGGMVGNELLMQFQADILGVPVVRPAITETTALGAAYAAGLAVGLWSGTDEIAGLWAEEHRFEPAMEVVERDRLYGRWQEAVQRSFGWA